MSFSNLSETQYRKMMLVLCYAAYAMLGLFLGMRTGIFNFIRRDYLDAYAHIATLILVSGIMMQLSLFYAGHIIEKAGFHLVLTAGLAASAVPLSLMYFVRTAAFFDFTYILFMLGYGIAMITLNLFVSRLVPERKGNALLMLHLFFSVGALAGPKWLSFFTGKAFSWQKLTAFSTAPLFAVVVVMLAIVILRPELVRSGLSMPEKPPQSESGGIKVLNLLGDPLVWLFVTVFFCSQIWEYGIGTWYVIFADETLGLSSGEAAFYLSLFYAAYPPVRIVFSRIIHRLNLLAVLLGAFVFCIAFGGLGALTGRLVFYSLTGAGIALMYPGIMAAMQHVLGAGSAKRIGFITMAGGMIQYVAIWSVGILSDNRGISFGFNSMLIYLFFGAAAVVLIMLKTGIRARTA